MNGYGASGAATAGVGQIAYTGVNTLGISMLAAGLVIAGLILLRLGAAHRARRHAGTMPRRAR